MHPVKRIEITADSVELAKLLDGFRRASMSNYTVMRNVESSGVRGAASTDVTMLDTAYIVAFCSPEQIKPAMEILRPILNKFGGSCYISDAMEIRSLNCVAAL